MSTVYLAEDETLDRPVAVKVLHREISDEPDQLERFRREARSAAKLSHPQPGHGDRRRRRRRHPYIVFEYVEGETLKQLIQSEGPLAVDEAVAYAIEIGRGLQAAHAPQLVHRDVKPQNVLIDSSGRAKVADFGIARSLEPSGMTATGRVLGTTDYVSPEQAMGEEVDERSDVYSLGIVLYEMLTGEVPFHAETQVGVAMKHVNEEMPDVQDAAGDLGGARGGDRPRHDQGPRASLWSVADMVEDLEATLEVEAARGGGTTGQATAVLDSVSAQEANPRARPGLGRGHRHGPDRHRVGRRGSDRRREAASPARERAHTRPGAAHASIRRPTATAKSIRARPAWRSTATPPGPRGRPRLTRPTTSTASPASGSTSMPARRSRRARCEVRAPGSGWDAEVRAAPGEGAAPKTLDGWEVVGWGSDLGNRAKISIKGDGDSRFYLLWLTRLPQTGDGYNLEVSDVSCWTDGFASTDGSPRTSGHGVRAVGEASRT